MKRYISFGLAVVVGALVYAGALLRASTGVTFTILTTALDNPIGIDWLPTGPYADQLLISDHYIFSSPPGFSHVDRATGAVDRWGAPNGWNNEIYFASVRPGQGNGWFTGDVFSAQGDAAGTGDASKIAQFNSDGSPRNLSFATLPGETKQKRGGVKFDQFGVAGNDLIVIAANDIQGPSDVYRINSSGIVTHLATIPVHLEGLTTVPKNAGLYGPLAGKILANAEFEGELWTIDPNVPACAPVTYATNPAPPACAPVAYGSNDIGMPSGQIIRGEDLWVVPANSTFYGVEFGDLAVQNRIWKADVSQWTDKIGRILIAQEYNAQLYTLYWNPSANGGLGGFVSELVYAGSVDSSAPEHWEHITFAPGTKNASGGFTTYTQGGWGAPPNGNNPGALLKANFATVYPSGVTIGGTKTLKFTSSAAIEAFLPAGGKPAVLAASATNATSSGAGVFAGQVLALQLSVDFSAWGITRTGLGGLKVASGPLAGQTVQQVLALANSVLGGGALPSGMTISQLNDIVDKINNNFDGGTANGGYLIP